MPAPRRDTSFVKLPRPVLFDPHLSHAAKVLYALLQSYAWDEGFCYPSQRRLAGDLGLGLTAFRKRLRELQRAGLVRVSRRGRRNTYTLATLSGRSEPATRAPATVDVLAPASITYKEEVEPEAVDTTLSSLESLAREFLAAIGYPRPSRTKRERAIKTLAKLRGQGYSLEEIGAACRLAVERGARGPELIPHVIGEAPPETAESEAEQAARAVREAERRERERWRELRAQFEALPAEERAARIARAQASSPLLARRPPHHPLVIAAAVRLTSAVRPRSAREDVSWSTQRKSSSPRPRPAP